jgi:hypothetical protein
MEYEELLQLKQLRNYTEAQRQNDGIKRFFFFIKNTGDLYLLICLIENWPRYAKNMDKFHTKNLGSLTPATTRKLFTLAKFYRILERRDSFDVLKNWIQLGDGSQFCRGHLEFAEIRELSEPGRVEALKIYSSQPLRFFFFAFRTNQYSKYTTLVDGICSTSEKIGDVGIADAINNIYGTVDCYQGAKHS